MLKKLFLLTLIALMSNVSFAAVDMFLNIDGIEGESQDATNDKEIDVLAWSWGSSNKDGKVCIQDVSVTKYIDKASPTLLMNMALGKFYSSAILTVRRPGSGVSDNFGSAAYLVLEFKNVSLNFEKIDYTYTPQNVDGSEDTPVRGTIMASKTCK